MIEVGQRWKRIFAWEFINDVSINEVIQIHSDGSCLLKTMQIIVSTNNNSTYCHSFFQEWISRTLPNGDIYSKWELLDGQEKPE